MNNNAFLSPRWGGMMVYNLEQAPEGEQRPVKYDIDMQVVMETFLSQLRLLLGITTQVWIL